jgi:hypothetical protein
MSARYITQTFTGKVHDISTSDHDPIYVLLTAGAFVAIQMGASIRLNVTRRSIT